MPPTDRTEALAQLQHVFSEMSAALDLCLERDLKPPALILLYSGIDIAGWMVDQGKKTVQESFTMWVDAFMSPEKGLGCTALELYGARCGVVHRFAPRSTLSDKGKVRKVIYAWLPSRVETLREMTELGRMSGEYVAVQGDDLVRAYKLGVQKFFADVSQFPTEALQAIAERVFGSVTAERAEALLTQGKRLLKSGQ